MSIEKMRRTFIGLTDIASFVDDLRYGLEQNNVKVLSGLHANQAVFQNSKSDFIIENTKNKVGYFRPGRISIRFKPWWDRKVESYYFNKAIKKCDIFIFIWSSFKNDFSDYKILKERGKKIITLLVGDDVRWYYAMKQEFEGVGLPVIEYDVNHPDMKELEKRLRFLRTAEKYSDLILGHPNLMQLSLRPYHGFHIPIHLDDYLHNPQQRKIPVIVHAPTHIAFKGTKYVESVIDQLKKEGIRFEYKRIEKMPRHEAMKIYGDSDIIIDQLLCQGGGKLAHECIAMGKVVLTLMGYDRYYQKNSSECPLVDVNPQTLYHSLKSLIVDYDRRVDIAKQGRAYVEKYNNPRTIFSQILEQVALPFDKQSPYYHPSFFRNNFIPESKEATEIYNKWTEYVKDCGWYKSDIKPDIRAGLKF